MRWVEVTGSSSSQRSRVAANLAILAAFGKLSTGLESGDAGLVAAVTQHGVPMRTLGAEGAGVGFRAMPGLPGTSTLRVHLLESPAEDLFHVEQDAQHPKVVLAVVCPDMDAFERAVRRRNQQGLEPVLPYRVPQLSAETPLPVAEAELEPNSLALMELFQEVMNHVG